MHKAHMHLYLLKVVFDDLPVYLSGWPSGLRRQTQGSNLAHTL